MTSQLRIVIGGDDAGFSYQSIISRDLASDARVAKVIHVGPKTELDKTAYSTFAIAAAEAVANGTADRAILICGTGLGVAIAASKGAGVCTITDPRQLLGREVCLEQ
ncbi:hypothetical protein NHJ13051_004330 [Beauveria bassiana]